VNNPDHNLTVGYLYNVFSFPERTNSVFMKHW